jgi:hypothetical protein
MLHLIEKIHLFNNVYISNDTHIDVNLDRIVISEKISEHMLVSAAGNYHGKIIAAGIDLEDIIGKEKTFDTIEKMFLYLKSLDTKVIIYAEENIFLDLLIIWLVNILKKTSLDKIYYIYKSLLFRLTVFTKSHHIYNISFNEFSEKYNNLVQYKFNTHEFLSFVSVEYLLASYLYDGSYKKELKNSLVPLIKKDLIKYLYEIKEIFFVHILTERFTEKLNLTKKYTFENFYDIITDNSEYAKLFTCERIWQEPFMYTSFNNKITFSNITKDDIELFKKFNNIAGNSWNEENVYTYVKSDINKLDFLPCFTSFTDKLLEKIIETEATFDHSAGSFFSIDLGTVNHYLIQSILENRHNKEYLKCYTLNE